MASERLFAHWLTQQGFDVSADMLVETRLRAQKLAFRALNVGAGDGEIRLTDLIRRQLAVLGLPQRFAAQRLEIEIKVEKTCLVANAALLVWLRKQKAAGVRIVAISDTTLSANDVSKLIAHCHGCDLIDRVYSSADEGCSKRQGALFSVVSGRESTSNERMLHIGDDNIADYRVPAAIGIRTIHLPLGRLRTLASRADGASTEITRQIRSKLRARRKASARRDPLTFGSDILGPIVTDFCLRIWLYADQASATEKTVLLFCARGGLGIRAAFEEVMSRLNLPLKARCENFLISRLVAARAAVIARSPAAVTELGREFREATFVDVACALGGGKYVLTDDWLQPFDATRLFVLLNEPAAHAVLDDIKRQNVLFTRHFRAVIGDAKRIILCDTGLYGSTQLLLAAGFPDLAIETIQFARANYKGHSEDHFPKVVGLVVEHNVYSPLRVETCVLRYWQLVESLFEPTISSVRLFHEAEDGSVAANCGAIAHGAFDPAIGNALLSGVLSYLAALRNGAAALHDAERSWASLRKAILFPTDSDLVALNVGSRSVDFGRPQFVEVIHDRRSQGILYRLKSIKTHLWREGAIAREFPALKSVLLISLEALHVMRFIASLGRR